MSKPSFLANEIQASAALTSLIPSDVPLLVDTQVLTTPVTWTIAPTQTGDSPIIVTNKVNENHASELAAATAVFNNSAAIVSSIDIEGLSMLVDTTTATASLSLSNISSIHHSASVPTSAFTNSSTPSLSGANTSGAPAGSIRIQYSILVVMVLVLATIF